MKRILIFAALLVLWGAPLALLLPGCTGPAVIKDPARPPLFGKEVDSLVVEPFRLSENTGTGLNEVDLALFRELFAEELRQRPFLRVFSEPPTELPNTVVLEGKLLEFEVRDLPGDELFLREIHIKAELRARYGGENDVAETIRRDYSFQKIYLPDQEIPVASFDLRDAAGELAGILAEVIYPSGISAALPLAVGVDPESELKLGHPLLLRGNGFAINHRFERARSIWRYLLFDPTFGGEREDGKEPEQLFRITRRGLRLLAKAGLDEETLGQIEPMVVREPMELVEFRQLLRSMLGGIKKIEGDILNLADHREDRRHLNLAAAHGNLGMLYWLERRHDRAAYHLARAYLNYPRGQYLEKWSEIQTARKLLPEDIDEEEAISLYYRLPPPRGMLLEPGPVEAALFTPVAFEEPPRPEGEEGSERGGEEEGTGGEVELQPVERPPVGEGEPSSDSGLPPIEAPVRAQ